MMSDIKSQAKSSRNTKLHALGGKGTVGKQLPTGAGSTWNGVAGVDSGQLADEQKIRTRKDGGRVGGAKMKARLDRKAKADGGEIGADWRHLKTDRTGKLRDADKISPDWRKLTADPSGKLRQTDFDDDDGMKHGGRAKRASGGKVSSGKGKTNITIVMAPGQGNGSQAPQAVPVPRPVPIPVQAPPAAAGPPPPIGASAPPMMPPGAPGMARKAGGRVTVGKGLGMTAGGGSGEGRIQKAAMQKRTYP